MADNKINYRGVLKELGYRKLLISTMINRFGDSIDAVAFTWLVYQVTHSGAWSAIIFGMNVLPNVIIQPYAGAVVERLDKKPVIVFTHILRALLLAVFMVVYLSGHSSGWIMAVFTFAVTSIESFNMPAGTAFIPRVLKKEMLTCGMSLNTMMSGVVTLVGTGMAGVIIAKAGLHVAMIIDIITFIIAAVIIMTIRDEKEAAKQLHPLKLESYLTDMKEGFRYIRSESLIMNYCIIAVVLNLILVPLNALQAPLVSECYKMGSGLLSVLGIAGSIGGVLGSALIPIARKRLTIKKIVITCCIFLGIATVILPMIGSYLESPVFKDILAGTCFAAITLNAGFISGVINIEFVSSVNSKYMARSSSVFVSLSTAVIPVVSMIVGWGRTFLSTSILICFCGVGTILFAMIILVISPALDKEKEKDYAAETA